MPKYRRRRRPNLHQEKKSRSLFFQNAPKSNKDNEANSAFFQAKLDIKGASDPSEKEADAVANQVVEKATSPEISRKGKKRINKQDDKEKPEGKLIQKQDDKEKPKGKLIQKQDDMEKPEGKLIQKQDDKEKPEGKLIQKQDDKEKTEGKLIQRKSKSGSAKKKTDS